MVVVAGAGRPKSALVLICGPMGFGDLCQAFTICRDGSGNPRQPVFHRGGGWLRGLLQWILSCGEFGRSSALKLIGWVGLSLDIIPGVAFADLGETKGGTKSGRYSDLINIGPVHIYLPICYYHKIAVDLIW